MSMELDILELKENMQSDLKYGASLQYFVEQNLDLIESLIRSKRKSGAGAITLKKLATELEVNFFGFKSALTRSRKKQLQLNVSHYRKEEEVYDDDTVLIMGYNYPEWQNNVEPVDFKRNKK